MRNMQLWAKAREIAETQATGFIGTYLTSRAHSVWCTELLSCTCRAAGSAVDVSWGCRKEVLGFICAVKPAPACERLRDAATLDTSGVSPHPEVVRLVKLGVLV